jgi:hypothetical protein
MFVSSFRKSLPRTWQLSIVKGIIQMIRSIVCPILKINRIENELRFSYDSQPT